MKKFFWGKNRHPFWDAFTPLRGGGISLILFMPCWLGHWGEKREERSLISCFSPSHPGFFPSSFRESEVCHGSIFSSFSSSSFFWCKFSNHGRGGGENFLFFFFSAPLLSFFPFGAVSPSPHTRFFGPLRKKKKSFWSRAEKAKREKNLSWLSHKKAYFFKEIYTYIFFICKTVLSLKFPSIDFESDSIEFYDLFLSPPFPELFPVFCCFVQQRARESEGCKRSPIYQETHWDTRPDEEKKVFFLSPCFVAMFGGKAVACSKKNLS